MTKSVLVPVAVCFFAALNLPGVSLAQSGPPPMSPPIASRDESTDEGAGAPAAFVAAPNVSSDALAGYEARMAELRTREAAALAILGPADAELLAELEAARATGLDPAMLKWEQDWFTYLSGEIAQADPQLGLELPGRDARLAVALMRMQLDVPINRREGQVVITLGKDETVLQVARAGSPVHSILWVPKLGYIAIPTEYVKPHIDRLVEETPLAIGGSAQ